MAITTINSGDSGSVSRTTINDNFTDLDTTKADLASPTFTGSPVLPTGTTGVTQSANDNSTKLATTAYVDAASSPVSIEVTSGSTHSLTTTAGQVVVVWAKGDSPGDSGFEATITLKYNGVTKDTVLCRDANNTGVPFCLIYTETPGAATANITVETDRTALENVKIVVMIIG